MSAGRLLRHNRRHAGMTQRDLARVSGIPQPMIARIESGATQPRHDTLERLLAATGAKLEAVPVVGLGVDRSLIRAALARSAEQRIIGAGHAARNLDALLAEVRRGRAQR